MNISEENISYPYILDHKPGFFISWLMYRLFRRIRIDDSIIEDLKQMSKKGTVVYAIKYRGKLDYILYHFNFRKKRLPYPKMAFDLNMSLMLPVGLALKIFLTRILCLFKKNAIYSPYKSGFYEKTIHQGTTSLVSLIDQKGFTKHFIDKEKDSIQFLLETQRKMDKPIFIVPLLLLFKKTPEKNYSSLSDIFFGFREHPGIFRKIIIFFRHNRRAFIDFGTPLNLMTYLESQSPETSLDQMTPEVKNTLIERIDIQKRVILGPIMKSKQQFKELVLTDTTVMEKIERMADGDEKKLKRLRKNAESYFDEIAADYSVTYVQTFHWLLQWFWKKLFEEIDVDKKNLARTREWARKGQLIYIPSHKSHIDYLILNDVLYDYHMHVPRVAAGTNLSFWPMGHIFRKSGAFFIRRSFKGTKLYSEIFIRYIKSLLEDGHPIQFYIEGGRSRNGKLMAPKTGFLSILLQAYNEGYCEDLIFVPASINYDRILEENSYIKELQGKAKEKENFWQFFRARKLLKKRYGKIYIKFNDPISLKQYLSVHSSGIKEIQRKLAYDLVKSINEVSIVTPLSLIATAILAIHRNGFHFSELYETAEFLLEFLKRHNVSLSSTLINSTNAIKDSLSVFIEWKYISILEEKVVEDEMFYYAEEDKKMELEYYKNSIIHYFIPHSFVALSLLTGTEEMKSIDTIKSDCIFLINLFRKEFVFDREKDVMKELTAIINYFKDSKLLLKNQDNNGFTITKLGFDKLPIWASLTKTFLESYWVATKCLMQQKGKEYKKEGLVKDMIYLGKRFYKLGVINNIGALSQINFQNAIGVINRDIHDVRKISEKDSPYDIERLSYLGQKLYGFIQQKP
jgi:glycerol-3-phosphate O-acyltransferase